MSKKRVANRRPATDGRPAASRKQIWLSDKLWERIQEAALVQQEKKGSYTSAAEYIRQATEEKLERDGI